MDKFNLRTILTALIFTTTLVYVRANISYEEEPTPTFQRSARSIGNIARLLLGGNVPPDHPLVKYPDPIQTAGSNANGVIAAVPGLNGKKTDFGTVPSYPHSVTPPGSPFGSASIQSQNYAQPPTPQQQQQPGAAYAPWQQTNQGYNAHPPLQHPQPLTVSNSIPYTNSYYSGPSVESLHETTYPQPQQQAHSTSVNPSGHHYNAAPYANNAPVNPYPASGVPYNAPYSGSGGSFGSSPSPHGLNPNNGHPQQGQQPYGSGTSPAVAYSTPAYPFNGQPIQQQHQQPAYNNLPYNSPSPYQTPQNNYAQAGPTSSQNYPPAQNPYSGQTNQFQNYNQNPNGYYGIPNPHLNNQNNGGPIGAQSQQSYNPQMYNQQQQPFNNYGTSPQPQQSYNQDPSLNNFNSPHPTNNYHNPPQQINSYSHPPPSTGTYNNNINYQSSPPPNYVNPQQQQHQSNNYHAPPTNNYNQPQNNYNSPQPQNYNIPNQNQNNYNSPPSSQSQYSQNYNNPPTSSYNSNKNSYNNPPQNNNNYQSQSHGVNNNNNNNNNNNYNSGPYKPPPSQYNNNNNNNYQNSPRGEYSNNYNDNSSKKSHSNPINPPPHKSNYNKNSKNNDNYRNSNSGKPSSYYKPNSSSQSNKYASSSAGGGHTTKNTFSSSSFTPPPPFRPNNKASNNNNYNSNGKRNNNDYHKTFSPKTLGADEDEVGLGQQQSVGQLVQPLQSVSHNKNVNTVRHYEEEDERDINTNRQYRSTHNNYAQHFRALRIPKTMLSQVDNYPEAPIDTQGLPRKSPNIIPSLAIYHASYIS